MSKSNVTELDVLNLLFQQTAIPALIGITELDIHLHNGDPGEGGTSTTNETTYSSYALQTVARTAGGWTCATNGDTSTAKIFAIIQFPICGANGDTLSYVSITPRASTQILYSGALTTPLAVSVGIQPQFAANALVITED